MNYRGFPRRLQHEVPPWVAGGAIFHVRIAVDREKQGRSLTEPRIGECLLASAQLYDSKQRWHVIVFLLMPDHLHALLSFADSDAMSRVIGDWKHYHAHTQGIVWQTGHFDHRLRNDERGEQLSAKINYIRQNPVAAGLSEAAKDGLANASRNAQV